MLRIVNVALLAASVGLLFSSRGAAQSNYASHGTTGTHRDHDPKHGGIFFMALDQKHHLEGVLQNPGTFRVYFYDAYSRPLAPAKLKEVNAKVRWGNADDAPETAMVPSKDGKTLQVALGQIKLPATLTLLVRFPGAPSDSKPELFTFPFSKYSDSTAARHGM